MTEDVKRQKHGRRCEVALKLCCLVPNTEMLSKHIILDALHCIVLFVLSLGHKDIPQGTVSLQPFLYRNQNLVELLKRMKQGKPDFCSETELTVFDDFKDRLLVIFKSIGLDFVLLCFQ